MKNKTTDCKNWMNDIISDDYKRNKIKQIYVSLENEKRFWVVLNDGTQIEIKEVEYEK